jgi:hypothetical protein
MIDVEALRIRYRRIAGFLDERGRRLFVANEALELGRGGVTAVSAASGIARSTIIRGIAELKAGRNELGAGIRRRGGGRKRAVEGQLGLLAALEGLIEGAIRGRCARLLRRSVTFLQPLWAATRINVPASLWVSLPNIARPRESGAFFLRDTGRRLLFQQAHRPMTRESDQ